MEDKLIEFATEFSSLATKFEQDKITCYSLPQGYLLSSPLFTIKRLFYQNNNDDIPFSLGMMPTIPNDFAQSLKTSQEKMYTTWLDNFGIKSTDYSDVYVGMAQWLSKQSEKDIPMLGVLMINYYLESFLRGNTNSLKEIYKLSNLVIFKSMIQSKTISSFLDCFNQPNMIHTLYTSLMAQYVLAILFGCGLCVKLESSISKLLFEHVIICYQLYSSTNNCSTSECSLTISQARANLYLLDSSTYSSQLNDGCSENNNWSRYFLQKLQSTNNFSTELEVSLHPQFIFEKAERILESKLPYDLPQLSDLYGWCAIIGMPASYSRLEYCLNQNYGVYNENCNPLIQKLKQQRLLNPTGLLSANYYAPHLRNVNDKILMNIPLNSIILNAISEQQENDLNKSLHYVVEKIVDRLIPTSLQSNIIVGILKILEDLEQRKLSLEQKLAIFSAPRLSDLEELKSKTTSVFEVKKNPTPYHNTLCMKCDSICYKNCSLSYTPMSNSNIFKGCACMNGDYCKYCKCHYSDHIHVKYILERKENKIPIISPQTLKELESCKETLEKEKEIYTFLNKELEQIVEQKRKYNDELIKIVRNVGYEQLLPISEQRRKDLKNTMKQLEGTAYVG